MGSRFGVLLGLSLAVLGCSSDPEAAGDPGKMSLEGVVSEHAATTLRFSATVKNTTAKAVKTLDSMEVDDGSGPKRATLFQECEAGDAAPWLLKAGASASLNFTIRNNGPDRMVIEGTCASSKSALWEFQTFSKIQTDGADPIELAMNGTFEGGAIWSVKAKSSRK